MAARPLQQYLKGEPIVLEGDQGDRAFRILSGEVVVCKHNSSNDLVPIAKLGVGEIFGEMYMFDNKGARSATVVAANDVVLEILYPDEMNTMLENMNPAMLNILEGITKRLRNTSRMCAETYTGQRFNRLPDGTIKQGGPRISRDK